MEGSPGQRSSDDSRPPRPLEYYRPVYPPDAEAEYRRRLRRDVLIYVGLFSPLILLVIYAIASIILEMF